MQPVSQGARRYDGATIFFHWATAALVVVQFTSAWTIDLFPRGPLRVDARSVHITLGVLIATLLATRIFWRVTRGRHLPRADAGALDMVARSTQWGLYALLAAMALVGMLLAWTRGDSLYNLVSIPSYAPGDRALAHQIQEIHGFIGWAILGLAGLHASAALVHRYLWHDGVLGRMLPRT